MELKSGALPVSVGLKAVINVNRVTIKASSDRIRKAQNREFEGQIRADAIDWVRARSQDGAVPLTSEEIGDYNYRGRSIPLKGQQGIWNPAGFTAALSIRTTYTSPDSVAPYPDKLGSDGLVRYSWFQNNGEHGFNVAVRHAMLQRVPLIWFFGIAENPATFSVMAPVYVLAEEARDRRWVLGFTEDDLPAPLVKNVSIMEESLKRYLQVQTKIRLHQPVFRSTVLTAYENHCAVCNLAHPQLLDAAHIVPDRDDLGIAAVVNGISLCKIHHAAFDSHFLGIRPDHVVEIRRDLLEEVDGPMLRHGLQDLHGSKLMTTPRDPAQLPRQDLLENAFERFRAAEIGDVA